MTASSVVDQPDWVIPEDSCATALPAAVTKSAVAVTESQAVLRKSQDSLIQP